MQHEMAAQGIAPLSFANIFVIFFSIGCLPQRKRR
jgi:hypothetical protein